MIAIKQASNLEGIRQVVCLNKARILYCDFSDLKFYFSGEGPVDIKSTVFQNCIFLFDRKAYNTLRFLWSLNQNRDGKLLMYEILRGEDPKTESPTSPPFRIDDSKIIHSKFKSQEFVYSGGSCNIQNVEFISCTFTFEDEALNTVELLKELYKGGCKKAIEEFFNSSPLSLFYEERTENGLRILNKGHEKGEMCPSCGGATKFFKYQQKPTNNFSLDLHFKCKNCKHIFS